MMGISLPWADAHGYISYLGAQKKSLGKRLLAEAFKSGPDRDRTDDLHTASVALSQLSYGPVFFVMPC